MFEHDLPVRVAASLLRGEPGLGRLGGGEQRGRHGDLATYFKLDQAFNNVKPQDWYFVLD